MKEGNLKYKIQKTNNSSIFKRMSGNRAVSRCNVNNIIKSIKDVGYILNPIIVNEKFEIIDGQTRTEALDKMGMTHYYIQVPNLTIKDCVSMNINMKNWSTMDFIDSYAEQGIWDYKWLQSAINNFRCPFLNISTIAQISYGRTPFSADGNTSNIIKNGNFKVKDQQDATFILKKIKELYDSLPKGKKIRGRNNYIGAAIASVYLWGIVNIDRLFLQLEKNIYMFDGVDNKDDAIEVINDIYNYKMKKKEYFVDKYKLAIKNKELTANRRKYVK